MPLAPSGVPPSRSGGAVRVLHAPSHAAAKGTDRIRAEVAGLAAEGAAIEYTELAGVPHADVLDALDRADVVVDQLYSDVAMAAFAAEAASQGVPAVVGSYAVAELRAAAEPLPPTVLCRPDEFAATLARLIDDADERRRHGDAARAFVLERLSPQAVARRFVEAVEDPAAATFDPAGLRYCHGACLSEDRARSIVRAVVEAGGKQALCVGDKPGLERALIAFALAQPDAGGGEAAGAPRTSS
jgi:hypothetical protein